MQVPTLAGEDVDDLHRLHAAYIEQGVVQLLEYIGTQGRRIDVDVGRHHFHGIQVQMTGTEQGQDFLGDTDAVDEADVDAHGALTGLYCRGRLVCLAPAIRSNRWQVCARYHAGDEALTARRDVPV